MPPYAQGSPALICIGSGAGPELKIEFFMSFGATVGPKNGSNSGEFYMFWPQKRWGKLGVKEKYLERSRNTLRGSIRSLKCVRPYVLVDNFDGKNAESSSVESTTVTARCHLSTGWILLVDVLLCNPHHYLKYVTGGNMPKKCCLMVKCLKKIDRHPLHTLKCGRFMGQQQEKSRVA
jgi:hypothetical protein